MALAFEPQARQAMVGGGERDAAQGALIGRLNNGSMEFHMGSSFPVSHLSFESSLSPVSPCIDLKRPETPKKPCFKHVLVLQPF
jgi:hypothetical protein